MSSFIENIYVSFLSISLTCNVAMESMVEEMFDYAQREELFLENNYEVIYALLTYFSHHNSTYIVSCKTISLFLTPFLEKQNNSSSVADHWHETQER